MKVLSFEEIIQRNAEKVAQAITIEATPPQTLTAREAVRIIGGSHPAVRIITNDGVTAAIDCVIRTAHAVAIDSSDEQAYGRVVANSARRVIRQHRKEIEALKDK